MTPVFIFESHVPRKVRIGYTNFYDIIDETLPKIAEADNKGTNYITNLIQEKNLTCSYCKKKLNPNRIAVIFLDQDDIGNKPVLLHIFCDADNCRKKWKKDNQEIINNSRIGEMELKDD